MRLTTLALTLGAASTALGSTFDYKTAHSKRVNRRDDSTWEHVVKGKDLLKDVAGIESEKSAGDSFDIANFNMRASKVDPSSLKVDTVKQYSGYLDNEKEDKHLFYWFFESRNDPKTDPVVLWLNGGPGCSSLVGLFQELGPATITPDQKIVRNDYSWNNNASVIFVDQPVNTGYSYSKSNSSDTTLAAADDLYALLTLFFNEFPEYSEQDFHISGESYAGHYIPGIGHKIVTTPGNTINLKSLLIGNGLTDPLTQYKYYEPMACGEGGYKAVLDQETCDGMKSGLPDCESEIQKCYDGDKASCRQGFATCNNVFLTPYSNAGNDVYDVRNPPAVDSGSADFLNSQKVRDAVGAEVNGYEECSNSVYAGFEKSGDWMQPIHRLVPDILAKIPVLIYAGDADYICNWLGNRAWTKALEWPGKDDFNKAEVEPLSIGDKQYGNLTTSGNFAFAQVFKAGHMVPEKQPEGSLDMLNRWVAGDLLKN